MNYIYAKKGQRFHYVNPVRTGEGYAESLCGLVTTDGTHVMPGSEICTTVTRPRSRRKFCKTCMRKKDEIHL